MDEALYEWRISYGISDKAFYELWRILFGHSLFSMPPQDILNIEEHVDLGMSHDNLISGKCLFSTTESTNGPSAQTSSLNTFAVSLGSCVNLVANSQPTEYPDHALSTVNMINYNDIRNYTGMVSLDQVLQENPLYGRAVGPAGFQTDFINEPLLGNSPPMENLLFDFRSSRNTSGTPTTSCDPSLLAPELPAKPPQRKRKAMAQKQQHRVEKPVRPCALCWFLKRSVCAGHLVIYTVPDFAYGL